MLTPSRFSPFSIVLLTGLLLQIIFIGIDCRETPQLVAIRFTESYFHLDPKMNFFLCKDSLNTDPSVAVPKLIERLQTETAKRGLNPKMAQSALLHLKTTTTLKSDTEAEVYLTASRKTAINSAFFFIGKYFDLGETYPVAETLIMHKENGHWKVCACLNNVFSEG